MITLPLEQFDIIYIDGSHQAAPDLMDAMLCWYRLKPGEVIIFDDYLSDQRNPAIGRSQMAIDLFLKASEGSYDLLLKRLPGGIRKHANQKQSTP